MRDNEICMILAIGAIIGILILIYLKLATIVNLLSLL